MRTGNEIKPRVLVLSPWAPFLTDAGSRRIWTACKYLKDWYDFYLLTFFNPYATPSGVPEDGTDAVRNMAIRLELERDYFRDIFREVRSLTHRHKPGAERLNGFRLPEDVRCFYSPAMVAAVHSLISEHKIDLVHVEFDLMALYVHFIKESHPSLPCVFTQHDVGAISLFHSYFREMAGWKRFLRLPQWWRRLLYTRGVCEQFDAVIVPTESDKRRLARIVKHKKIRVVPTGVDTTHFSDGLPWEAREPYSLVYVGYYLHYPNEDAVLWFVREILPLVWERLPQVKFYVVGSYPTERIRSLSRTEDRIVVTGTVPDVKPYEMRSMAMVAPLRLGRGIKGKVLEAFAVGTPVAATSCANDGIGALPEEEILLADSPRPFARQVLRILQDRGLWNRLSGRGRALIQREHAWERRASQLDVVYRAHLSRKMHSRIRNP